MASYALSIATELSFWFNSIMKFDYKKYNNFTHKKNANFTK